MIQFALVAGIIAMAFFTRRDRPRNVPESPPQVPIDPDPPRVMGYLDLLNECVASGAEVPDWLVSDAVSQAYDDGNISLAMDLADLYDAPAFEKQAESSESVESPQSLISPLKGVSDADWTRYVEAMKSGTGDGPDGYFHFNPRRLQKLGFSDLGDYSTQVSILVADTLDNLQRGKSFLDNVGSTVVIDGQTHIASASGLLAVIKAAGPSAPQWLANENDKKRFPETTALFLRANNCF